MLFGNKNITVDSIKRGMMKEYQNFVNYNNMNTDNEISILLFEKVTANED